jgi:hypothetical protein
MIKSNPSEPYPHFQHDAFVTFVAKFTYLATLHCWHEAEKTLMLWRYTWAINLFSYQIKVPSIFCAYMHHVSWNNFCAIILRIFPSSYIYTMICWFQIGNNTNYFGRWRLPSRILGTCIDMPLPFWAPTSHTWGGPPDASFLTDEKNPRNKPTTPKTSHPRNNEPVKILLSWLQYMVDHTIVWVQLVQGGCTSTADTEQINIFVSKLNLLDPIGIYELNHTFSHSQRLNGDAIVAFVKTICKVSMTELQSPTDLQIFCLTKIDEVA